MGWEQDEVNELRKQLAESEVGKRMLVDGYEDIINRYKALVAEYRDFVFSLRIELDNVLAEINKTVDNALHDMWVQHGDKGQQDQGGDVPPLREGERTE